MALPSAPNIYPKPRSLLTSVMLWWQPPTYPGSVPLNGYVVTCPQINYTKVMPLNSNQVTVTGLSAGINYTFFVAAKNGNGTGPPANFDTVQVGKAPSRPTNIVASLVTDNDALVSWSYAQGPGEAPVRYFIITPVPTIPGSAPSTQSWIQESFSDFVIQNLSTGIEYSFLVQAINDVRYSPYDSFSNRLIIQVSWIPTNLLNIQFWFDASKLHGLANGDQLTSWTDQTGISAANPAPMWNWPQYIESALNGLPIIRFDPRSLLLVSPLLPENTVIPTSQSFFAVSRQTGGLNRRIFGSYLTNQYIGYDSGQKQNLYLNGPPPFYNNTPSDSSWDIISLVLVDNTSTNFYWNGTSLVSSNLANNLDSISFNGTGDTSDCEIAEVIFYNTAVLPVERQVVEGYLAWKWGLQTNLPVNHPYRLVPPAVNFTNKVPPTSFISISQVSGTPTTFTISWVGTVGATAFTFTINGEPATPSAQGVNSATFSDLSLQTAYTVVITARNLFGQTISLPFIAYLAPTKPLNISITNALTTAFTVNWDGGEGASSYRYSINGTTTTPQSDQGVAHGYATFNGLTPNVNYTIIVTPINTGGQTPSDPFIAQAAPASPTGLTASNINAFTFSLSWVAPVGATSYDYQITPAATAVITGTTAIVSNLYPLTQYTVSIIANNAFGGTVSPSINVTTLPSIFNPYIVGGSNTPIGAQITWVSTTGISYQYVISPGLNNAQSTLITDVKPPLTLSTLYPNSTYTVTFAQIVGSVVSSVPSFNLITQPSVPSTATAVKYSSATISSFSLFWNTGFATSSLTFYWGANNITKASNQSRPMTFSTLLSGTAYPVYINAANITGSVSSQFITAYTLPGPTYNLVLASTTPTSITVSWSGGNGATSYIYTVNGIVTSAATDNGVSARNARFAGLNTNTSYIFTVTPVNDAGVGQTTFSPLSQNPYYWFDASDNTTFSSTLTNGNTTLTWSNKGSATATAQISSLIASPTYTLDQINGLSAIGLSPSAYFSLTPSVIPLNNPTYSVFAIFKGLTALTDNTSYIFNMNPVAATSRILYTSSNLYLTTGNQTKIDYRITSISSPNALLSTCLYSMVINAAGTVSPQGAWFNGTNQPTVTLNTGGITGTVFDFPNNLGNDSTAGASLKYDLGEFLIMPSVLNTSDRQRAEGYLAWKWGIQSVLPISHPNKAAPPSGTWSFASGPGAPTNLSTSAITFSSFVLYWQGALGASSLTFHVGTSTVTTANTSSPYSISSLTSFTTYPVYIVANSLSGSTSSNAISVLTAPGQPIIYASTITTNSFNVHYSGATGASSLTIYYNTSTITINATAPSPLSLYSLNSGSTYTVYVDAVNTNNHTLSNTINVTTAFPPSPAVALGRLGVGNGPFLAYSLDGVSNWTPIVYPAWSSITGGIATSGPLYLMVLNDDVNTLYSSLDCISWTPVGDPVTLFGQGPNPDGVALNGIAYGNGIWIAVVNSWVFASFDEGLTWRKSNQYFAGRVFFSHNKFFCESSAINQLQVSTDGLTWSRCITNMNPNPGAWGLRSIDWDEPTSRYLAAGYASSATPSATIFWTSPDGLVWTPANQSALSWTTVNPSANYLVYIFGKWWTTNDSGYALCYSSDNGSSWYGVSPAGLPTDLISLYGNGYLVANSPSQGWYYTSNGINWNRLPSANALSSSGYNGYYYIFGTNQITPTLAPGGIFASNVTANSFSLSWFGAVGASSLTFQYNSLTVTVPANTLSPYTITLITPSTFTVSITATTSAGQQATSNVIQVATPPSPAQSLIASNPTLYSVDIAWSGAYNASSLTFFYNTSSITVNAQTQTSPYTITGLEPATAYATYIVATNVTNSVSSLSITANTAFPPANPATNLIASNVTGTSLSLSWAGGGGASSITIVYNNNRTTFRASQPSPRTVSPLTAGSTFSIYMLTTNPVGLDTTSNTISVFTPPLLATNLSASNANISSFAINWAGAQGASSLTFYYNSSSLTVPASQPSPYTISSLTVATPYIVYMDATNIAGKISSNSITVYTVAVPSLQQATVITNSSFQLTWSNTQGASSLTFFYNSSSLTVPISQTSPYSISSLTAGSRYTVYMNATIFGASSVSSNSISVLTTPTQPSGVAGSNANNSSFQISWSNAQGASSFTFNYNLNTLTVPATQTSPYTISSLGAGSTFTVYMQANNNTGSVSSNNFTINTYPNQPTNLNLTVISYSTLSVDWSNSQGASSLTFYYNTSSLTVPGTQTSPYTISSLNAGSTYSIHIDAIADSGLRVSSNTISVLTDPKPAQVLSASNNTPSSFAINWSGAEGASSLTFFYNTSSLTVAGSQTSPYTISSLTTGTTYVIRIDATEGAGPPISSNQITTYTSPVGPAGFATSNISPSSVTLSWSGVQGASSLVFYYNTDTVAVPASQISPYTLTTLTAGSTYSIYLDVVTASGLHASTTSISVLTAPLIPTAVAINNPSTTSFQISWTGAQGASSLTFHYNTSTTTVNATQTSPYTLTTVTAGSTYNVSIDATNQTATASSVSTIAYTQANIATSLSYSNPTATSFAIAWSSAQGASSLTFYYNTFNTTVNAATQTSPYTLNTSITAASTYTVYIASNTSGGLVTSSNTVTAYTTAVAPSALVASGITYNSANIAWSGTQGASSLTFYYNTNSTTVPATQTSPYTMNTFTAGSSYTIYINTTTLQGLYASSNTISVLTSPLAATSVSSSNPNTTSFQITWSGAQGASSLTFHYNSNTVTVANQASPYTLATATAGSTYTVYIDATNLTASVSSGTTTVYTKAYTAIGLSYSNTSQSSFQVNWSGAQGASSLTFFYNNFNQTVPATQTSPLTISTSLTAGSTYTVLISTITSGGLVTTSNTLSAYTTAYAPTGLTASNLSPSSFAIAWSNAQGASSLTFYYNSSNLTVPVSQTSPYTISSLAAGTQYNVYINATTSGNLFTSSASISVLTAPLVATSVATGSYSQSSFAITWSGAQGASSLTFYYNSNSVTVANQASPYNLTGLTAGSTYTVAVGATNATANVSTATTNGYTTAYAATSLAASNQGATSFDIAWSGAEGASSLTFNYNSSSLTRLAFDPDYPLPSITISSLTAGITYTVSITATTSGGQTTNSASIYASTIANFTPTASSGVPGMQLWFDASDPLATGTGVSNGTNITTWYDKSGNSYNTTAVTGTIPYNSTTGGLTFNGNSYFALPNGALPFGNSALSIYVLVNITSGTSAFIAGGTSGGGNINVMHFICYEPDKNIYFQNGAQSNSGPYTNGQTFLAGGLYDPYSGFSYVGFNGGSLSAGANVVSRSATSTNNYIGCDSYAAQKVNGTIYEILVYNVFHTAAQRQMVEGYLAWKWGLQSRLPAGHPYKSATPTNAFTPALSYVQPLYWFDTSNSSALTLSGSSVTAFTNQGVAGNTTSATSVTLGTAINSLSTITFGSGGNHHLALPTYAANSYLASMFVVFQGTAMSGSSAYWFFQGTSGSAPDMGYYRRSDGVRYLIVDVMSTEINYRVSTAPFNATDTTYTVPTLMSVVANNTSNSLPQGAWVNGTLVTDVSRTGGSTNTTYNTPYLGNQKSDSVGYNMAEYVHFPVALTTEQRQKVEGYLAWKWGLQSSLPASHPYYSAKPTVAAAVATTLPLSIPGMQLWFDAADPLATGTPPASGTVITTWYDKSGNKYNTTGGTTNATYSAAGLVFSGNSQYSLPDGCLPFNDSSYSYFFVLKVGGTSINPFFSGGDGAGTRTCASFLCYSSNKIQTVWHNAGNYDTTAGYPTNQTFLTCSLYSSGNEQIVGVNGTINSRTAGVTRVQVPTTNWIGYGVDVSINFGGTLCEIICYNTCLSTSKRQQVEGYLAWKWGIQTSLPANHPYYSTRPT